MVDKFAQTEKQDIGLGAIALAEAQQGAAAFRAAENYGSDPQLAVVAPAAGTTVIVGPLVVNPLVSDKFIVEASVAGIAAIGATDASVAVLQTSVDGGGTWQGQQTVPFSGLIAAGVAAATTVSASLLVQFNGAALPATAQFRVVAEPIGAGIAFSAGQGAIFVQELPH